VAALGSFFGSLLGFVPHPNPAHHAGLYVKWEVALAAAASCLGVTPFVPWVAGRVEVWKQRLGSETRAAEVVEAGRQVACLILLVAIFVLSSMKLAAGTHNPFFYFRF
jgi:alginate O-acetyltransferase complex protein AlgI